MGAASDFRKLRSGMRQMKRSLVDVIEEESAKHFQRNFDRSAWHGSFTQPWKPRKDLDTSRRLLVKTGDLRRSATTPKRNIRGVKYVLNQVYASVHNNGERAGRGAGFQMPKRQFIGQSRQLDAKIIHKMKKVLDQYFNKI